MKNLNEFKTLIKKYESITLEILETCKEKIEADFKYKLDGDEIPEVLEKITNYDTKDCALCKAIGLQVAGSIEDCHDCAWVKLTNNICYRGVNCETYDNIGLSTSIEDLKKAVGKRAKYMKEVLKQNNL